ncbi:mannitol dehydrogenase family protein [Frateuria aurantia]
MFSPIQVKLSIIQPFTEGFWQIMSLLNASTLKSLPQAIERPAYDRGSIRAGIAHIGVGAFHRAHLAVYLNQCLSQPDQAGWGLLGINLLEHDRPLAEALQAQDGLYTVTALSPEGEAHTQVVGTMVEYLYAPDHPAKVLERLADPSIRIVSLTITEGGYLIDHKGRFQLEDATVQHDLASPEAPQGVFGYLIGALALRRERGITPFTIMSCDNLRHNGSQARRACLAFAEARDPELAGWIGEHVAFPNAMVDRITPATTPEVKARLNELTGVEDQVPVLCEDFVQWVLEDRFGDGRPAFERAGVQLVSDVTPYEEAKIRLLNGAHQMLSYPAFMAGLRQVDVAVRDPLFHDYLRDFLDQDAGVWLHSLPGMELDSYKALLLRRFGNHAIGDQLARLCLDGGSKIPGFLMPTLESCLANGRDARRLAYLLACYDVYLKRGTDDAGEAFELREPNAMDLLEPIIQSESPLTLLQTPVLVGPRAAKDTRFVAQYLALHEVIRASGARHALQQLDRIVEAVDPSHEPAR